MKSHPLYVLCAALAIGSFCLTGCSNEPKIVTPEVPTDTEGKHVHDHGHGHHGPHDGHIIELGNEEYHAELVHDDAAHKVTVYILDGGLENAVPIEAESITINLKVDGAPKQFTLAAAPLDGEADGKSSRFEIENEELLHELEEEGSEPELAFSFGDQSFRGAIEMGHDHDHDHGDGHDHDDHDHGDDDHKHE